MKISVQKFYLSEHFITETLSNVPKPVILDFMEDLIRFQELVVDDEGKEIVQNFLDDYGLALDDEDNPVPYIYTSYFSWRRIRELYSVEVGNLKYSD